MAQTMATLIHGGASAEYIEARLKSFREYLEANGYEDLLSYTTEQVPNKSHSFTDGQPTDTLHVFTYRIAPIYKFDNATPIEVES